MTPNQPMRLPRGAFLFRIYCGKEVWFYQVVGDGALLDSVEVMYAPEDGSEPWRHSDYFRVRGLRGSARTLALALREASDRRRRESWSEYWVAA